MIKKKENGIVDFLYICYAMGCRKGEKNYV